MGVLVGARVAVAVGVGRGVEVSAGAAVGGGGCVTACVGAGSTGDGLQAASVKMNKMVRVFALRHPGSLTW